jgi:hypothetical protein
VIVTFRHPFEFAGLFLNPAVTVSIKRGDLMDAAIRRLPVKVICTFSAISAAARSGSAPLTPPGNFLQSQRPAHVRLSFFSPQ